MLLSIKLLRGPFNTKTPYAIPGSFLSNRENKKKTTWSLSPTTTTQNTILN
jgi:hypothetical protein